MEDRILAVTLTVWASDPSTIANVTEKFAGMVHGFGLDGINVGMQINPYVDPDEVSVAEDAEEPRE